MSNQIHSKFKVFVSDLENGVIPNSINVSINEFIALNKVAAKSVGIEFVEFINKLVISIGYVDGQSYYPVTLESVVLGKLEFLNLAENLEKALTDAASSEDNSVICHEFYVDSENNYVAVFLKVLK